MCKHIHDRGKDNVCTSCNTEMCTSVGQVFGYVCTKTKGHDGAHTNEFLPHRGSWYDQEPKK